MSRTGSVVSRGTAVLLRPYRISLSVAGVIGLLGAGASLCQPIVIGWVVGRIVLHHSPAQPFLLLVALFLAEGILGATQVYLLGRAGNGVVKDVRLTLVSRLIRSPMAAHAGQRRGDLFSTTVADTSILGSLLAQSLATLMSSLVMVLGSLAFMAYLDPVLTAAVVGAVVITGVPTFALARRLRQATQENRDRVGSFGASLERAVTGVSTVKISRAEGREESRISGFVHRSYEASMRATRVNAMMSPSMGLAVQASFMVVFTVGAYRLASGDLSTSTFSSYILYLLYLIAPLLNFFMGFAQYQQSAASAARVTAVVENLVPEQTVALASGSEHANGAEPHGRHRAAALGAENVHDVDGVPDVPGVTVDRPTLELSDVSFGYRDGEPTVHDVSFTVPRRGLTAIVGPSGAGKSTVFGLIVRLWKAQSGRITLHGTDVDEVPLEQLRGAIGFVEQNAAILDGTLRDNLTYANPAATDGDIDEALESACLRSWVDRLPAGLETPVGEGGTAISGGERQRIAVARMLLVKPDVLLLDEATAHLDAESEAALNITIGKIAQERAVVTIAHQISTAIGADHVLVLDAGRIRAQGTHDSLMRTDELYQRLVHSQSGAAADRPGSDPRSTNAADPGEHLLLATAGV